MRKLFLLVGESGAGKSVVANELEKYGYKAIPSCTTRQPRYKGETGHLFVDEQFYERQQNKNNIVAYTYFDNNHYFVTKDMLYNSIYSLYIIDPDGIRYLKEKIKDIQFVTIYIKVSEDERVRRMMNIRNPDDVKQRIENDKKKFESIEYDYVVPNNDFNTCVNVIKSIIETELKNNF